MPNPSTLTAQAEQQYHFACAGAHNLRLSKATREIHLRNARALANEHGFPQPEAINGRPAVKVDPTVALRCLLDQIVNIDRDEDGDAMLDAAGLDELKLLARQVRSSII